MKWRMKDGELRVRISPEDKEDLMNRGLTRMEVGPMSFILSLDREGSGVHLSHDQNEWSCHLPGEELKNWLQAEDMGWTYEMDEYKILVEKDLSCSHSNAPLNSKKHFGHKFD